MAQGMPQATLAAPADASGDADIGGISAGNNAARVWRHA
jgi:hypothetical protein